MGGPQYRPQNTIGLMMGTLEKLPLIWETPIFTSKLRVEDSWSEALGLSGAQDLGLQLWVLGCKV